MERSVAENAISNAVAWGQPIYAELFLRHHFKKPLPPIWCVPVGTVQFLYTAVRLVVATTILAAILAGMPGERG